jgi:uncharacterized protein (DUF58 family)
MNEKRNLLLLLVAGLICAGLIVRNGKVLILAIPLLVYLITGLLQAPARVALRAERSLNKNSIGVHEPVRVRLRVENEGAALINLQLEDGLLPSLEPVSGQTQKVVSLPAGGTADFEYVLKPERGAYSWASIRASCAGPLELFFQHQDVAASGELLVLPSLIKIRPLSKGVRSTKLAAGPIPAHHAGTGTNYWGVREYTPGDTLRRLNWRLAARHPGKWFTNEFESEEIADFGLILDTRKLSNADQMEEVLFEHAISAAASIAEISLKHGNRVSLLLFGQSMRSLFPGFGKQQLDRVLENLGRAQLGDYVHFSFLKYFPVRLFPVGAQIIILSTLDRRDLEGYARLRSFGYDVLLVSPDPVEYAFRTLPESPRGELAHRAARVERIVLLKRLVDMGVKVVNWPVERPLDPILHESMKIHLHGRRV